MVQTGSGSAVARVAISARMARYGDSMIISDFDLRYIIQMEQIQALRFEVEEVGKHVKGSKKRFTWDISLKDKYHTVILDFSFISGKVKITVDRKILLQNELPSNVSFQYPFTLEGFALNIIQQGQTFELRINNKVFSHLYTQHKTNTEFKRYEEQVKDIKVTAGQFNAPKQKVQLNIGAFGNMKKKEKVGGGAEGWNAFSGGSFPNYFGQQPSTSEEKPVEQPKKKTNLLDEDEDEAPQQPSKVQVPKKQSESLLNDFAESSSFSVQSNESPFEMSSPQSPPKSKAPAADDFNTMQNLFSTMNVGNGQSSGQMDFFASEQPKKEVQSVSTVSNPSSASRIYDVNHNSFATGVGMGNNNATSNISFATSAPGGSGFDFSAFSKKQPVQQQASSPTMENIYSGQSGKQASNVSNPLTDMSLNDFMSAKSKQNDFQFSQVNAGNNVNSNEFNTMQNFFQTNSGGNHQNILSSSTDQTSFTSANTFQAPFQITPNENDFSTLQQMFQTSNYAPSNISISNPPQQPQQTQQQAPSDPFKKEKMDVFATMGGAKNPSFEFDMSNFGTMQAGSSQNQGGFDFFESKPAAKSTYNQNNLI